MYVRKVLVFSIIIWIALGLNSCFANHTGDIDNNFEGINVGENVGESVAGEAIIVDKPVTLTLWNTANGQNQFAYEQEQRFLDKYPNIKMNKIMRTEGDGTDYLSAYAAGNAPDAMGVGQPQMSRFIHGGVAAPLDEYLDKWQDMLAIKKSMFDKFVKNGKHYAIPEDSYLMVLTYNKKIFEEAGAEVPTTWDELIETAKQLTIPEKQQWGMNLLLSQWTEWWFEYFVWQAGGDLTGQNPDGTLKLTFTDPAVVEAIMFYRKLIAAKCIQPDINMGYEAMQKEFAAGHVAMTINGSDAITFYVNNGMNPDDCGYALLPKGPNNELITQMGGSCTFITANLPKEKEKAVWLWLAHCRSKEEVEKKLLEEASRGAVSPLLRIRTDVDYVGLGKVRPDLQTVIDQSVAGAKLEFFGKGIVGKYVDTAVRKAALDPDADIIKIFQEQQDIARRDAADPFNNSVKN